MRLKNELEVVITSTNRIGKFPIQGYVSSVPSVILSWTVRGILDSDMSTESPFDLDMASWPKNW